MSYFNVVSRKRGRSFPVMSPAAKRSKMSFTMGPASTYRIPKRGRLGRTRTAGYYGRTAEELKFLDTDIATTNVATTGTILGTLNQVPQDDGMSGRTGRKITIKSISVHGTVNSDAAVLIYSRCRCIVYIDKQANGAVATAATILQTTDIDSFRNMENIERYTFLYDKTFILQPQAVTAFTVGTGVTTAMSSRLAPFRLNKKCNIPIIYDASAATGAIGTIRSNNIGMLFIGENIAAVDIQGLARIRYSDI